LNPDSQIIAFLSQGPKSPTELETEIVSKGVCARQTLFTHLRSLVNEGRIKRNANPNNNRVKYTLAPESLNHAKRMMDIINLESLVSELRVEVRKELKEIHNVKGSDYDIPGMARYFYFKNLPEMNFRLHLDEDTARIINRVTSTSDLASQFHTFISKKFYEMRQSVPMPSEKTEELDVFHCLDWSQTREAVNKIAMKYGLSFLLLCWYDGRQYRQRIMSALKNMKKLERNHAENIYFLDEVDKRCYFLDHEYGRLANGIIKQIDSISEISDPSQLLHNAFLFHFGDQQELIGLEIALSSDCIRKELPEAELFNSFGDEGRSYPVLTYTAYAEMKIPFLSENERKSLLMEFLVAIGKECASMGYQEEHRLAVDILKEKLGATAKAEVKSPVMNFRFDKDNERMDFSKEPFVTEFLSFKENVEKRKWLQKCLLLGLPVFHNIPFVKLGFEVKSIF